MDETAHPQPAAVTDPDTRAKTLHAANGPRGEDHAAAWDAAPEPTRQMYRDLVGQGVVKNPFPTDMTVPGVDGQDVTVDLAVLDGVVYAPNLDDLPITADVRQYVTQYCAAWSSSVLTTGKLAAPPAQPPRRAQLVFHAGQLHAMLGLAPDETIVGVVADPLTSLTRFVVESPRLPRITSWADEPPIITLPVAARYETGEAPR